MWSHGAGFGFGFAGITGGGFAAGFGASLPPPLLLGGAEGEGEEEGADEGTPGAGLGGFTGTLGFAATAGASTSGDGEGEGGARTTFEVLVHRTNFVYTTPDLRLSATCGVLPCRMRNSTYKTSAPRSAVVLLGRLCS